MNNKGRVFSVVPLVLLALAGCSNVHPEKSSRPQDNTARGGSPGAADSPRTPVVTAPSGTSSSPGNTIPSVAPPTAGSTIPSVAPPTADSTIPSVAPPIVSGDSVSSSEDVRSFGAVGDGVADDRAAFQSAIDTMPAGGTITIPRGTWRLSGQLLISGKSGMTLQMARDAILLFDDGDYVGLLFTAMSQRCSIRGGSIRSNNKVNPRITLLKLERASAYATVDTTEFAYGGTDVLITDAYIVKLLNTIHSNSNTAIRTENSSGSNADILISGATFGTTMVGDDPVVDIQSIGTRLLGAYFETTSHTKPSVVARTGSQEVTLDMHLYESGEVQIETSVFASLGLMSRDSYSSVTQRLIRVDGGAVAVLRSGSQVTWGQQSSFAAISNAGSLTVSGMRISKAGTAILNAGRIAAAGLDISGSRVGLRLLSGSTGVVSASIVRGNSTDIDYVGGEVSLMDIQADSVVNSGGQPDRIRLAR